MPRRKHFKNRLNEINRPANVLQSNRNIDSKPSKIQNLTSNVRPVESIGSILDDENCCPAQSSTSTTAALYDELDSFRQRWRRELEETKRPEPNACDEIEIKASIPEPIHKQSENKDNNDTIKHAGSGSLSTANSIYAKAKKLFMTAVELEKDDMHFESIRYYKQAMHLCPNIEKQIFREECEAKVVKDKSELYDQTKSLIESEECEEEEQKIPLYDRIRQQLVDEYHDGDFVYCKPSNKHKPDTVHISDLPHELIMQIFCYVVGQELDLASLESLGLVCRGFFYLSRDPLLWQSICSHTWGKGIVDMDYPEPDCNEKGSGSDRDQNRNDVLDWRNIFRIKCRLNFDGVYISRTKYIRQGDSGFQDLTYRPFHVISYFRYIRFFPNKQVLILTTNEEPDKICPIFRHATSASQFSPELSILEGSYEFDDTTKQVMIVAEKDYQKDIQAPTRNQHRQSQFHWSRQTPMSQKFNLKFELRTLSNKPYRNNLLKWLDYSILSRFEREHEVTPFELSEDTFPNLTFCRVKMFNLKLTQPLVYC